MLSEKKCLMKENDSVIRELNKQLKAHTKALNKYTSILTKVYELHDKKIRAEKKSKTKFVDEFPMNITIFHLAKKKFGPFKNEKERNKACGIVRKELAEKEYECLLKKKNYKQYL